MYKKDASTSKENELDCSQQDILDFTFVLPISILSKMNSKTSSQPWASQEIFICKSSSQSLLKSSQVMFEASSGVVLA